MSSEVIQSQWDDDKILLVPCEDYCGMLAIRISKFTDGIHLAMWRPEEHKYPWSWRLRYIWNILRGKPYADELILDKSMALKLAEWIKENVKEEVI